MHKKCLQFCWKQDTEGNYDPIRLPSYLCQEVMHIYSQQSAHIAVRFHCLHIKCHAVCLTYISTFAVLFHALGLGLVCISTFAVPFQALSFALVFDIFDKVCDGIT